MAYTSFVVGTDGSATAEQAVRVAAELSLTHGADLVVVAAHTEDQAPGPAGRVATAREAAERARALTQELGATAVVARTEEGPAAEVLLAAATATGADLIVVGSRGMTGAARLTIGAVAGTISHHAPCDVLIVHTAG